MPEMTNFSKNLSEHVLEAESIINEYLPEENGFQKVVLSAMNYSVSAGGKRLRPVLMQEAYRTFGGTGNLVNPFMAAMEFIHTYSLVHDDLPAMDNDELRRGKATTWKVYGEAMGILAGDALLNYAFETACSAFDGSTDPLCAAKALKILARKAGIYGMIGGQVADVYDEGKDISKEEMEFIHLNKTCALIEASLMIGALLAGAGEKEVVKMEEIGRNLGMAFQIQDDILDVVSTTEELGKPVGSDEKNAKNTYVSIYGMERSKEMVKEFSDRAIAIFDSFEKENEFLRDLMLYLMDRKN